MWAFHTFFVFPLYHFSLFAILSVDFLAYAHPLHECSKYRKGVDHFDLYLASGLGWVKIRFQRRPSVKFSRLSSQQYKNYVLLSYIPIPFLARKHHLETFESRTARALAPLCSYVTCYNTNIDSCLLWLELNYMPWLLYLKVLIWLIACHHRNYACYHLPTRGRAGIKLGDVDTSKTYL